MRGHGSPLRHAPSRSPQNARRACVGQIAPGSRLRGVALANLLAWLLVGVAAAAPGPEPSQAPARGGADTPPACASLDALAAALIGSLERHDAAQLESLQLPLLDQCRSPETHDLYQRILEAEAGAHVDPDARLVTRALSESELEENLDLFEKLSGERVGLPIPPTHVIELTARAPHPSGHPCASQPARIRKFAARHDGCWRVVPQCLSRSMIESMRERRIETEAIERMREELFRELDPEQRDTLLEQLRAGESQAAFESASELYGSRGKAFRLIERLCEAL